MWPGRFLQGKAAMWELRARESQGSPASMPQVSGVSGGFWRAPAYVLPTKKGPSSPRVDSEGWEDRGCVLISLCIRSPVPQCPAWSLPHPHCTTAPCLGHCRESGTDWPCCGPLLWMAVYQAPLLNRPAGLTPRLPILKLPHELLLHYPGYSPSSATFSASVGLRCCVGK